MRRRVLEINPEARVETIEEFYLPTGDADKFFVADYDCAVDAIDTVSVNGSILSGYATYRALPIPRGGEKYGAYNWRMTEHHRLTDPFAPGNELNQGTGYTEIWSKDYNRMIGNPEHSDKRADWSQQANPNAHSPAFVFTNRRIDDDFKGNQPARDTISLQNAYDKNFCDEYDLKDYRVGTNATIFSPQGGLRISFEELAHALEMLMNGGTFHGKEILTKQSVDEMLKPHWIYDGKNGDTQGGAILSYGLGVYPVKNLIGHTGEAFGLLSGLYFIPNTQSGFVFMINGEARQDFNYVCEERILNTICNFIARYL